MTANAASFFRKVVNAEQYWVGRHQLQAGDIVNDSSITGTTVADALENLSGGGSGPLLTLNGQVGATQTFSTANSGTDFTVVSSGGATPNHQFRLPDANNLTARGVVSTGPQTFGGVKTFSSAPVLTTGTLTSIAATQTFPSTAQTLVGQTSVDTLTNKTMTDATNNVTCTGLFTSGGTVNVSASGPPIANYVLMATGANAATWQPVAAAGAGILSINGLTDVAQAITSDGTGSDISVGTSGTGTTVIHVPSASTTARGVVTTGTQSFIGAKTFTTDAATFSVAPTLTSGTLTAGANLQTFPSTAQTLVGRTSADTLTNKTLTDATTYIADESAATKIAQFECSALTAGATKTFTFPDVSMTFAGQDNAQVLTNKTLTNANNNVIARGLWHGSGAGSVSTYAATAPGAGGGQVLATDVGGTTASWQTVASLGAITTLNTLTATTQTFAAGSAGTDFAISSATSTHTFNIPTAGSGISRGLVTNGSQVLYGAKTFNDIVTLTASPVLSTGTITVGLNAVTVPNATDTLVALATTDALTNKTMTSTTNNVTAKGLFVNGGTTVTVNATGGAPSANQVLMATSGTNAQWSSLATNGVAITSINGNTNTAQTLSVGSTNDGSNNFNVTSSAGTTTFNLLDASATARGAVTTGTQTFAGAKTFSGIVTLSSAPVLSTGTLTSITSTITFPTSNATLVGLATTDTLTNKSLVDASTYFVDNGDATKKMQFQISGVATGTTRTLTVPNASDTIVCLATTDTLTNKTLNSTTNTVNASGLFATGGTPIVVSGATAPTVGQVLTCNATGSYTANWQTPSTGVSIVASLSQTASYTSNFSATTSITTSINLVTLTPPAGFVRIMAYFECNHATNGTTNMGFTNNTGNVMNVFNPRSATPTVVSNGGNTGAISTTNSAGSVQLGHQMFEINCYFYASGSLRWRVWKTADAETCSNVVGYITTWVLSFP